MRKVWTFKRLDMDPGFKLMDDEDQLIRPDPIDFKNETSLDFLKTLY
jgi:hypothetical protein